MLDVLMKPALVLSRMILGYGGPVKNYSTALLKSAVDDDDDRDGWDAIHWSGQQTTSVRRASESGMASPLILKFQTVA